MSENRSGEHFLTNGFESNLTFRGPVKIVGDHIPKNDGILGIRFEEARIILGQTNERAELSFVRRRVEILDGSHAFGVDSNS